jgi:hypothetical protein
MQFNPYVTTAGRGLFNTTSVGGRQGTAYADPSAVYRLRGGVLNATETLPMWGGVGIYENVPGVNGGPAMQLGVSVGRANSLTGAKALAGFSVFDQNYAAPTTPQSQVPLTSVGGLVNSYALGSKARIWVKADPILVNLRGGPIGGPVAWDFVNQLLVPYEAAALAITSGTYNNATGLVTLVMAAPVNFGPGDAIVLSGLTGTGAFASLNGTYTSLTAAGTSVTYNPGAGLGASTITGGNLALGSGAASILPVTVLEILANNCETVLYDPVTGFGTYDFNGCAAVIQL